MTPLYVVVDAGLIRTFRTTRQGVKLQGHCKSGAPAISRAARLRSGAMSDVETAAASKADSKPESKTEVTPRHTNRLAAETSPYLLQHAHNPVDWYPWGPEALTRA